LTDTIRTSITALRRERELRGWSQQHVADAIGAPAASYLSRWERGAVSPSPYYQERLCELFGRDAEQLGFLGAPPEGDIPVTGRAHETRMPVARRGQRRSLIALAVLTLAAAGATIVALVLRTPSAAPPASPGEGAVSGTASVDGRTWPLVSFDLHRMTETVRAVQLLLSARGLDIGATGPDGVFGAFTESAVRTFQTEAGLPSTGIVDGATWERLVMPIGPTDRGRQVEAAQRLLTAAGASPPPTADGVVGPQTQAATRSFQSAHGLPATGDVDLDTWLLLVGGHR
jgi:peptidoglycan hydrolase-like protein with peptidoglycan-binding domain/DNA-binding XRE family transcriptional regulator